MPRPPTFHGNMFSTQMSTPLDCAVSRTTFSNRSAYSPCQRNGGCTTTVDAPVSTASCADRSSFTKWSLPHTNDVSSSVGAWIARIGWSYAFASTVRRSASRVRASVVTMTSTPS